MCGNDSKEKINLMNYVIGSTDVKAMYPSTDIDLAVEKCVETILKKKSSLGTA